jgi:putative heme-binding domain-containing protein
MVGLDYKYNSCHLSRDTNWPLRIAELHAELARRDPRLNVAILDHADFPRPGNVVLTRCPGFNRRRAAERFYEQSRRHADFGWTAELVSLMGELPDETARPLLLSLWDRGGFEEAILPILAKKPRPDDRDKFVAGLRSPQLSQIGACLNALEKLPAADDSAELLALVRALRSLGESKADVPVGDRIAGRLQKLTGQLLGHDKAAWTAWLTRTHPDLAAKLGGTDGVDVAAWQKRLGGIDWANGEAERGRAVFTKASCASCHSGGSAVGPDLRGVGGRFGRDDLLTAILQPSKDIAARYRTVQIGTRDGKAYQGLIVYEAPDGVMVQTGPAETVRIAGSQIDSRGFTDKSLMPAGLLDKLTDGEIADLVAYLKVLK